MRRVILGLALLVLVVGSYAIWPDLGRAQIVTNRAPTFNKEVVRILQNNCQVCHRPGDIAPFSLTAYEEAAPRAELIKKVTQERTMPPWKAVDGCTQFADERKLSIADIQTLARWSDAGAPEGLAADMPVQREFLADVWQMGAPDQILTPDVEYAPDPNGTDIYRCFVMKNDSTEGRWISGVDVRPGNRSIVHHVLLFTDTTGGAQALDMADPGPGYTCFGGPGFAVDGALGGWAPGNQPIHLPDGIGIYLAPRSSVVMQVHYHPNGRQETDRTQVGLYYAKVPVNKQFRILPLVNTSFVIPAGAPRHEVKMSFTLPTYANAHVLSITPHMHLLGREMHVKAVYPNRSERCLIDINDWDFQWQNTYFYPDPIPVPGGTRLELTAYYDNSENNPNNPNSPPKAARWGEATTDEMCIAFLGFTLDAEELTKPTRKK